MANLRQLVVFVCFISVGFGVQARAGVEPSRSSDFDLADSDVRFKPGRTVVDSDIAAEMRAAKLTATGKRRVAPAKNQVTSVAKAKNKKQAAAKMKRTVAKAKPAKVKQAKLIKKKAPTKVAHHRLQQRKVAALTKTSDDQKPVFHALLNDDY